ASSTTPRLAPTPPSAPPKASRRARSSAASSATSPAGSSASSKPAAPTHQSFARHAAAPSASAIDIHRSLLAIAISIRACLASQRVQFATATQWVARLSEAKRQGTLEAELRRLERYHLLVVDEIGYLPLERQAANLLFALVSRRYERGSIIVTSNRGFEQWGEILGDAMVAAALIDRLVHHATMITLKGKS